MSNQTPNGSSQFVFDSSRYVAQPAAGNQSSQNSKLETRKLIALVAGCSLIGAVIGGGTVATANLFTGGSSKQTVIVNNTASVNWVTAVAQKAEPSVVTISVSDNTGNAGSGSGIVLTADGYILTNTHVVTLDGVTANPKVDIKTSDGKVYAATIVGTDPTNDLAVIKVHPLGSLTPAAFANSDKLNVGDNVVAIGAPLGLDATVTSGIVSALNRTIQVANSAAPESTTGGGLQFLGGGSASAGSISLTVIQTDAAINPGNSGGALINQSGEVVGVNVAIASAGASSSSGQSGSIGVGFSIPANNALRIAHDIIKTGKASHALLGVYLDDVVDGGSGGFSVGAKIVKMVAGGPGQKAGLKVGDIVTEFNGKAVTQASDLQAAVRLEAAGSTAVIKVLRGKTAQVITVQLGNAGNL